MSLVILFFLKSILSNTNIVSGFLLIHVYMVYGIIFHLFTFNLHIRFLFEMSFLYNWVIFYSINLCCFIGIFKKFIFNVIFIMIWFKSAILLFIYLFSLVFFFSLFYFLSCGLLEYFLKFHVVVFCFVFFLAVACSLQDISSPTRDWTWDLSSESRESQPLNHQGISPILIFLWWLLRFKDTYIFV